MSLNTTTGHVNDRQCIVCAAELRYSLKSGCLWELDILQHWIRKLRTYEELHTVFISYLRCGGICRFLSAAGNDCYRRTRQRGTGVYESACAVTDTLTQEAH
jgi:hypothetical protein